MKYYLLMSISVLILSCCSITQNSTLPEFPVDIDQNISFPISEIAEEITAIELKLTDESLINPDHITRIIHCDNAVIICEYDKILLFNTNGQFIRSIGSKGQGPGEYRVIDNIAIDEKNRRLFVIASSKIICYDLEGNFLKQASFREPYDFDINYINNELLLLAEHWGEDKNGIIKHAMVYRLNDDLQNIDSCLIRITYSERLATIFSRISYYLLYGNSMIYLYYPDNSIMENPAEIVLRDTLYRFEQNQLFPELKLKFKNDGIDRGGNKFINLRNLYRSSRYIFAMYHNMKTRNYYYFCYDTKTGKGYNMQDGYTDDIHQIEKRLTIHPLTTNTEMFYYWHTHMKPDDREEPNPTLYIGRLKK